MIIDRGKRWIRRMMKIEQSQPTTGCCGRQSSTGPSKTQWVDVEQLPLQETQRWLKSGLEAKAMRETFAKSASLQDSTQKKSGSSYHHRLKSLDSSKCPREVSLNSEFEYTNKQLCVDEDEGCSEQEHLKCWSIYPKNGICPYLSGIK